MKKLIVTLIVLLTLPLSVMAMDAVTNSELDGVSGQDGVTIGFSGTSTTTITFASVAWGDSDGCGGTACATVGWIIIDGTVTISQVIADGQLLKLDVGTATANCTPITGSALSVPNSRSFIAIQPPRTTTSVTLPTTLTLGLANSSTTIDGTLGLLYLESLSITPGTPTALVIWAHT